MNDTQKANGVPQKPPLVTCTISFDPSTGHLQLASNADKVFLLGVLEVAKERLLNAKPAAQQMIQPVSIMPRG